MQYLSMVEIESRKKKKKLSISSNWIKSKKKLKSESGQIFWVGRV